MKQGDHVSITTDDNEHDGVFVNETDDHLFIKLDSGYNIGIDKKNIIDKDVTADGSDDETARPPKQGDHDDTIHILHTGGTIASKVDYATGGVTNAYDVNELLSLFPELTDYAEINSSFLFNKSSEDLRFDDINDIIDAVEEAVEDDADGVIIGIGTDTLHYVASALSYALRGVPCPVVLVGAQRSSDRPSSDAARNLISAAAFITSEKTSYDGVAVSMHGDIEQNEAYIHRGVNARKCHTSRRDAFKSVNATPLTAVRFDDFTVTEPVHEETATAFNPAGFDDDLDIAWVKTRPHMPGSTFDGLDDADGVIVEGTGLGHAPLSGSDTNQGLFDDLARLADDTPVVMTSQAVHGRLNHNVYSHGRRLKQAGVLGHGHDETPEAAYMKLAWLLSNHDEAKARQLYDANIAGEYSPNSSIQDYHNTYDA